MPNHHLIDAATDALLKAEETDTPTNRFRIVCALTGDEAEATTAEGALLAAATLVDDDLEIHPNQGRTKALRNSLYIVENGTYAGILTSFAQLGYKGPLA